MTPLRVRVRANACFLLLIIGSRLALLPKFKNSKNFVEI